MIEPEPLQQIDRTSVRFRGRKLIYFSGCDYFRLASHPRVLAALEEGLRRFGLNVAASRLTTGNHHLYARLETRLANFFGAESALLVPSGYMSNLVAAQALAGNFSHALIDEQAHPSLIDAGRLLDCPVLRFKHRDPQDMASVLHRCGPESRVMLLTDGLFSDDGSTAPLRDYAKALPGDALMLVDDAHGAGILGKSGKGSLEHAGIGRRQVVQTITLSKAFGVYGGVILGTNSLRQKALERSRLFVGSTPLPLPLVHAAVCSLELVATDKTLRRRLAENSAYVKAALRSAGYALPEAPGPILAVLPRAQQAARDLYGVLFRSGIYPPLTRYPGGLTGAYFRFVFSSEHNRTQLDRLVEVLTDFKGTLADSANRRSKMCKSPQNPRSSPGWMATPICSRLP